MVGCSWRKGGIKYGQAEWLLALLTENTSLTP